MKEGAGMLLVRAARWRGSPPNVNVVINKTIQSTDTQ